MNEFVVSGYTVVEGGLFFAVSNDGRFVTHGATPEEALEYMDDLLNVHWKTAKKHGFDPSERLSRRNKSFVPWERRLTAV